MVTSTLSTSGFVYCGTLHLTKVELARVALANMYSSGWLPKRHIRSEHSSSEQEKPVPATSTI
jgi:hypothetical protein